MFSGYKTYIVAAVSVIGAIAAYLTGEATVMQTAQLCVSAILAACVRNGIAA
jgi:hypothetical protein